MRSDVSRNSLIVSESQKECLCVVCVVQIVCVITNQGSGNPNCLNFLKDAYKVYQGDPPHGQQCNGTQTNDFLLFCPGTWHRSFSAFHAQKVCLHVSFLFDPCFQLSNSGPSSAPATDVAFSYPLKTTNNRIIYYMANLDVSSMACFGLTFK